MVHGRPYMAMTGLVAVVAAMVGCSPLMQTAAKGLPVPPVMPGTMALETFSIVRPMDDPLLGPKLWDGVDEQALSVQQRTALWQNGFRVGVVGGQMPQALEVLLGLRDTTEGADAASSASPPSEGEEHEASRSAAPSNPLEVATLAALIEGPWRHYLMLPEGVAAEVRRPGEAYQRCSVVIDEQGSLKGRPFLDAQCVLRVTPLRLNASDADLEFRPEIHHGPERLRPTTALAGGQIYAKDVAPFPHLAWRLRLGAGQIVLVTMRADRPESLGWHFFHQAHDTQPKQRLLVFRVEQISPARRGP